MIKMQTFNNISLRSVLQKTACLVSLGLSCLHSGLPHRPMRTTNMLERVNQDPTYEGKRNNRGLRILRKKVALLGLVPQYSYLGR